MSWEVGGVCGGGEGGKKARQATGVGVGEKVRQATGVGVGEKGHLRQLSLRKQSGTSARGVATRYDNTYLITPSCDFLPTPVLSTFFHIYIPQTI